MAPLCLSQGSLDPADLAGSLVAVIVASEAFYKQLWRPAADALEGIGQPSSAATAKPSRHDPPAGPRVSPLRGLAGGLRVDSRPRPLRPCPSSRPRSVGRPARMTAGIVAAIALLVTRRRARSFDRQYLAAVRRRDPACSP